jgi:ATP-binding cassette, subfamily B, bacterial CvaB/MchF/RaxB
MKRVVCTSGFWSHFTLLVRGSKNQLTAKPIHKTMSLLDRLQLSWGSRIPVILQTEASECGLACIAMLLAQHGTITDLATLRRRHGAVPQGMTLLDLARVAKAEQLTTRAVRVDLSDLKQLRLPAILHWSMGHFVVLHEINSNKYQVIDPAYGERTFSAEEMSNNFTGVAMEAWPAGDFVAKQEAQSISIKALVGRVSGLWPTLWRVLAVSLTLEVLGLIFPLFMQWVVDNVVVTRDVSLLTTLTLGFLLLLVAQQLFTLTRSWLVLKVGTQLRVQWRSNVLSHMLMLPLDYFARRHLGDVMSRFESVDRIQKVLTDTFVETALDGLMVVLTLALMLVYSPVLTVIAVFSVLIYAGVRWLWFGPMRRAMAEHIVRNANESSFLLETVRGMRTIRLFSRHAERLGAWQSLMVADVNANLKVQKLEVFYRLMRGTLSGAFALLLIWWGARDVMAGTISVGMLLAFLAYRNQFDSRFTELVNKWVELRMLGLDAQRLADIVLTKPEASASVLLNTTNQKAPSIEIKELYFRYSEGSPDVLAGLNLTIPAGQAIAIAGASGGGKTTLVNLLLGVYQPQRGGIYIDGVPFEQLGASQWRAQVATVMQDDVLFAGSIADNISFFDPTPDQSWLQDCAAIAAIHDDITKMPMAYQTLVGDMGSTLSGGQKQRVLLARALYRRPYVLMLDEATSHLDIAREAEVSKAIAGMPLTRIVVAHRPQTLASVDRVVEIENGIVLRDETAAQYAERVANVTVG